MFPFQKRMDDEFYGKFHAEICVSPCCPFAAVAPAVYLEQISRAAAEDMLRQMANQLLLMLEVARATSVSLYLGKVLLAYHKKKENCWHNCFYRIRFIAALKMLIIFYNWLTAQSASAELGVWAVNRLGYHRRNNDTV